MSDRQQPTSSPGPPGPPIISSSIVLAARPDGAEDIWSDTHLADADHRAWRALGRERQRAAYATWRLLVDEA